MDRIVINDYTEVSNLMLENIDCGAEIVSFIGLYCSATEIIKALLINDKTNVCSIQIEPEDWDGYDKEWLITLDDDYNIWCEKLCRDTGYIIFEADIAYIVEDCNSACLKKADCDAIYEVGYNDEDCHCSHCCTEDVIAKSKDGKILGFNRSWDYEEDGVKYYHSVAHYSDDEDYIKHIAEKFNIKLK